MPQASPLPANIPWWAARRPHLAVALLRWRNACRLRWARVLAITAPLAALAAAVLLAPPTGRVLRWLADSPLITLEIGACLFGFSAARRQERIRSEAAASWLAALPVRSSSILRLALGAAVRLVGAIVFVGLAWAAGQVAAGMALRLVILTAAGALAGTLAGARWAGGGSAVPSGWHYASVRRARPHWATAPSLVALAYWPIAQGRVFSRPSTLRVVLFALLAVPAGRRDSGEVALAVGAGCITAFTLLSLSSAAVRIAGDAARWLAPTTIRSRAFTIAFAWRVAVKQAAVLAVVIFLACAVDYPQGLRVGWPLAVAYLAVSCAAIAVACSRGSRRVGLGTAGRGR